MCRVHVPLAPQDRKDVARHRKTARPWGRLRQGPSLLAILAVMDGQSVAEVALGVRVPERPIAAGVRVVCCAGRQGAPRQQPTGRPPPRTPTPQETLAKLIDEGAVQAGVSGACWRSPRIPQVLSARLGVFYNVFYLAQLRKNRGLRAHKAAVGSEQLDGGTRPTWCTTPWPQLLRRAKAGKALLRFGDDASCPQWGPLTSTGARRGPQPQVKTAGKRQGDPVGGRRDDFPGRLFYHGQEGRLTSAAYRTFLTHVLEHTTPHRVRRQEGAQ
jgi:hypothetical protein